MPLSLGSRLDQTREHLTAVKCIAGQYSLVIPNEGKGSKESWPTKIIIGVVEDYFDIFSLYCRTY